MTIFIFPVDKEPLNSFPRGIFRYIADRPE
jgi:hypothetical protein